MSESNSLVANKTFPFQAKEEEVTDENLLNLSGLRVCVVVDGLSSCAKSEEFSYDRALACLAQAGCHVTLLALPSHDSKNSFIENWQSLKGRNFIHFIPFSYQGPSISSLLPAVRSYQILQWLQIHAAEFDIVHFPLTNGLAYYTLLAKHQGWAFQHIQFCMDLHFPTLWRKQTHKQWIDRIDDLAADFLERESIRLSDCVLSRNDEVLSWMRKNDWQFSQKLFAFPKGCHRSSSFWEKEYLNLHVQLGAHSLQEGRASYFIKREDDQPFVSVCLTHFNRPHYLAQALDSIRAQDYSHFEVVLVDDASTQPEALAYLDSLAEEFKFKRWKIIRNKKNLFPGAARNLAAQQSQGEYLLFMDDDNYANFNQISTFVKIARQTHADILTCAMDVFEGQHAPVQGVQPIHRFLPLGAAAGLGLYLNIFGDMNALIKKKAYEALNGLTEEHGVGGEDWEFFSRAVLQGYHLETVPLSLFWYRDTPNSITKTTHLYANSLRGIRSYLDVVPPALRSNLILSQAQQEKLQKMLIDHHSLGKALKHCWQLFFSRACLAMRHPCRSVKKVMRHLFEF